MPSIALYVGVVLFGLGAILSLLSAVRTLQKSRSWSNFRHRQRMLGQARGSLVVAVLCAAAAAGLLVLRQEARPATFPVLDFPATVISRVFATRTPTPRPSATTTASATPRPPTPPPVTPSSAFPATAAPTATPSIPIAVEAMIQGTATPTFKVQIGRLRFATTINGYQLIAPGESFPNPIKQMYSVFTYQPADQRVPWIALWYQNGDLKNVDVTSWEDSPPGIGIASWARDPVEWQAGDYELQIFIGTAWKATGSFSLTGEPPTFTATASATASPPATATRTPPPSATPTLTATASPMPTETITATLPPLAFDVYFTSTRSSGSHAAPYSEAVKRQVPGSASPIDGVLSAYFAGPTAKEEASGLIGVYNGFTGYRRAELESGIVNVYLEGNCQSDGTPYTIAQPLIETLKQLSGVNAVKIFDEYDHTRDPLGPADSWPVCLDVTFTSTWTPLPTITSTPTATPVPTAQDTPTATPSPSPTIAPTLTAVPTASPSSSPTASNTASPTASATEVPPSETSAPPSAPPALAITPTSLPVERGQPAPSIIDSILMFLRQLFGGR
jgi:hypothetical protein